MIFWMKARKNRNVTRTFGKDYYYNWKSQGSDVLWADGLVTSSLNLKPIRFTLHSVVCPCSNLYTFVTMAARVIGNRDIEIEVEQRIDRLGVRGEETLTGFLCCRIWCILISVVVDDSVRCPRSKCDEVFSGGDHVLGGHSQIGTPSQPRRPPHWRTQMSTTSHQTVSQDQGHSLEGHGKISSRLTKGGHRQTDRKNKPCEPLGVTRVRKKNTPPSFLPELLSTKNHPPRKVCGPYIKFAYSDVRHRPEPSVFPFWERKATGIKKRNVLY